MGINIDDISEAPWTRYSTGWSGSLISVDGCDASDFKRDDVARVIVYGWTSDDRWDGRCAGIAQLHDGRYIGWESSWGPTGSGFHEDAYGGDADILFGRTREAVEARISEAARELWGDQ